MSWSRGLLAKDGAKSARERGKLTTVYRPSWVQQPDVGNILVGSRVRRGEGGGKLGRGEGERGEGEGEVGGGGGRGKNTQKGVVWRGPSLAW